MVYSTCSLSPQENELVVAGVLAKWGQAAAGGAVCEVVEAGEEGWRGERRQYGRLVLPDVAGYGPLYYCVLEKGGESRQSQSAQAASEGDSESESEDDSSEDNEEADASDSGEESADEG